MVFNTDSELQTSYFGPTFDSEGETTPLLGERSQVRRPA